MIVDIENASDYHKLASRLSEDCLITSKTIKSCIRQLYPSTTFSIEENLILRIIFNSIEDYTEFTLKYR